MKRVLIAAACVAFAAVAQAQAVYKPPVEAPVQGTPCELPSGGVGLPMLNYDANGRIMRCIGTPMGEKPKWRYVAESDSDRLGQKLEQLNATNMQILAKLTELVAAQQASSHK